MLAVLPAGGGPMTALSGEDSAPDLSRQIGNGAPWDIFTDGMSTLAEVVEWLDAHLDESVAETYKDQPLAQDWARVAKVTEEAGEAIDALIGLTGQNPRKGKYGSLEHLLEELADVALTGIYAIQHFTKDAESSLAIVVSRAQHHRERVAHLGRSQEVER